MFPKPGEVRRQLPAFLAKAPKRVSQLYCCTCLKACGSSNLVYLFQLQGGVETYDFGYGVSWLVPCLSLIHI